VESIYLTVLILIRENPQNPKTHQIGLFYKTKFNAKKLEPEKTNKTHWVGFLKTFSSTLYTKDMLLNAIHTIGAGYDQL